MTPLTRRATAEYRRATPAMIERGRAWYPDAHVIALSHAEKYGVTLEQSAGILAALSPRMPWRRNVYMADRLLSHGGTLDSGCLRRSLAQASRIYCGDDPLKVMGGLKTRAFYEAVRTAGRSHVTVIDVHAWAMLIGERGTNPPNRTQYREADACMQRAADIVGEDIHAFQAITWLAWRARFWRPGVNDHTEAPMLVGAGSW